MTVAVRFSRPNRDSHRVAWSELFHTFWGIPFVHQRSCYCEGMSAATALDGLLDPLSRCLDAESARRLVELRVDSSVQERVDALAERANEGLLSSDEHAEYEALINAADFISILKSKARKHLSSNRA
jgi:hypothetical protein